MSNTKVIRAKVLGYCMGVRRATDTAIQAVKDYSANRAFGCNVTDAKKVATLGPLIHNRIALEQLKKRGLGQIETENVDEINAKDNPVIILRAHGEPPATKRILGEKGCTLIDATCPRVLSSQKRAGSYALKGYTVIIAGDNNHAEVIGISGYAQEHGQACYVVENSKDAQQLLHEHFSSEARQKHLVVLIAQTTFSPEEYEAISRVFKKTLNNIKIVNTICSATYERQQALKDLCEKVDGIVVIGGKNSANTQRLYLNAKRWMSEKTGNHAVPMVVHVEQASEVPARFFKLKTIGLTAGASTPDEIIDEVEARFT